MRITVGEVRDSVEQRSSGEHKVVRRTGGLRKDTHPEHSCGRVEQTKRRKRADSGAKRSIANGDSHNPVGCSQSALQKELEISNTSRIVEVQLASHPRQRISERHQYTGRSTITSAEDSMSTTPIDLLKILSVTDVDARTHDDIFVGLSIPTPNGRAFGGQVLGQAVMAAGATVDDSRILHSIHSYFLRPGRSDEHMTFAVNRLHDARSFTTRRTQVYQRGEVLKSMIASFQLEQDGLEHQVRKDMTNIPQPETLPSDSELYGGNTLQGRESWILSRPFDIRYLTSDILIEVTDQQAEQAVWIRTRDTLPDLPLIHSAALAFGSDYTLTEPILRAHGIPWATPGLRTASLDHAMWFHRPFRADDWLLYTQESPTAQGARGLTHGRFYNRDGDLVASVSQEAMVRATEDE